MENKPNIELRSDEVNDILKRPPAWIIRWGITVTMIILAMLIAGSIIFRYPDKITAPIVISSENMPVRIMSRSNGRLTTFNVRDNENVKEGQVLAVVENTTNLDHYYIAGKICDSLSKLLSSGEVNAIDVPLPASLRLGELQESYSSLSQSLNEYKTFVSNNYHRRKIEKIKNQVGYQRLQIETAVRQLSISTQESLIATNSWQRDSLLFVKGALSSSDMEQSKREWLTAMQQKEVQRGSLNSLRISMEEAERTIFDIEEERYKLTQEFNRVIKSKLDNLRASMAAWERSYLLKSPVNGRVSLAKYWDVNQNVHTGDIIATIIPDGEAKIIGKIFIPVSGAGKVKSGQRVNVKIDNYPFLEYGMLTDTVERISEVPALIDDKNVYVVTVHFPRRLVTGYRIEIPGSEEMSGIAEIITNDVSILKRIIYPFRHLAERITRS